MEDYEIKKQLNDFKKDDINISALITVVKDINNNKIKDVSEIDIAVAKALHVPTSDLFNHKLPAPTPLVLTSTDDNDTNLSTINFRFPIKLDNILKLACTQYGMNVKKLLEFALQEFLIKYNGKNIIATRNSKNLDNNVRKSTARVSSKLCKDIKNFLSYNKDLIGISHVSEIALLQLLETTEGQYVEITSNSIVIQENKVIENKIETPTETPIVIKENIMADKVDTSQEIINDITNEYLDEQDAERQKRFAIVNTLDKDDIINFGEKSIGALEPTIEGLQSLASKLSGMEGIFLSHITNARNCIESLVEWIRNNTEEDWDDESEIIKDNESPHSKEKIITKTYDEFPSSF